MDIQQFADLESHHIEGFAAMGMTHFKVPLYSHVEGNLWQGGCPVHHAPTDVEFIINLYRWGSYQVHGGQILLTAELYDAPDIGDPQKLIFLANYVNYARDRGKTLVHCQAGLNRSTLIVALSLMLRGSTPEEAIKLLRRRSKAVLCNSSFERWLRNEGLSFVGSADV